MANPRPRAAAKSTVKTTAKPSATKKATTGSTKPTLTPPNRRAKNNMYSKMGAALDKTCKKK